MRDEIEALERHLLEPAVRADPAALAALLHEEFREFGQSGLVFDRAAVLEHLSHEAGGAVFRLERFEVLALGSDHVLATFIAIREAQGGVPESRSLRSSVWQRSGDRWRLRFHQGTAIPPTA